MNVVSALCILLAGLLSCNAKILLERVGLPPAGPAQTDAVQPDWGTITQRLDHFSITDNRTWTMRYMNNSQFHVEGGPMFILLGGEWEITEEYMVTGQMFDMARQNNGYMFYTEHRFYGKSYPMPDFSVESFKYLSTEQALADIAYFITQKKEETPGLKNSKVVIVGFSYTGSLAVWARIKYPHLITAVVSSSAPIGIVEDHHQYLEVISKSIESKSKKCLEALREGTAEMVEALEDKVEKKKLEERINVCKPIKTDEPYRSYFFNTVIGILFGVVQNSVDGDIEAECEILLSKNGSAMENYADYVAEKYGGYCISDYDQFVETYSGNETTQLFVKSWFYQACTEIGTYRSTKSDKHVFGDTIRMELYHQYCLDFFGDKFTPELNRAGIRRNNIVYGATHPDVTNVISVHGTIDPYHPIGILEDLNPQSPAIFIEGTSHCADMNSISPADPPQLKAAKIKVQNLIAEWIK